MPRRLQRSSSLCTKQERKRRTSTASYTILRDCPFVHKTRFLIYASKAPRRLFGSRDEYEQYLTGISIRYYNVWKRTSSAAFPHRQDSAFVAVIAQKLQVASVDFRRRSAVDLSHRNSRLNGTIAPERNTQEPSPLRTRSPAVSRHAVSATQQRSVLPSAVPSRHVSVASFLSVASSNWPDRISRTRPSFTGSRWQQTLDSTTVSGFSSLPTNWTEFHPGAGKMPLIMPKSQSVQVEKDLEEAAEQRREEDNLLKRLRKTRIGRAPIPAGMLRAITRQKDEPGQQLIRPKPGSPDSPAPTLTPPLRTPAEAVRDEAQLPPVGEETYTDIYSHVLSSSPISSLPRKASANDGSYIAQSKHASMDSSSVLAIYSPDYDEHSNNVSLAYYLQDQNLRHGHDHNEVETSYWEQIRGATRPTVRYCVHGVPIGQFCNTNGRQYCREDLPSLPPHPQDDPRQLVDDLSLSATGYCIHGMPVSRFCDVSKRTDCPLVIGASPRGSDLGGKSAKPLFAVSPLRSRNSSALQTLELV